MDFKGELYNMMPISNIASVIQNGILSNEKIKELGVNSYSVAMKEIQEIRDGIEVPGGMRLHSYANLYFDARNPMLSKIRNHSSKICILTVNAKVLELDDVVLTDQNATSRYAKFLEPKDIREIKFDKVYMSDWNHDIRGIYLSQKSQKCAEVLVPNCVPFEYVISAQVINAVVRDQLIQMGFNKDIRISPNLFF